MTVKNEKLGVSFTKKEVLKIITGKYKYLLMKVTKFEKVPATYDFYKDYQTQFFDKFELNQDLLKDLY